MTGFFSKATRRSYMGAIRSFRLFCRESGQEDFPALPSIVASYLRRVEAAGSPATALNRLCAISWANRAMGHGAIRVTRELWKLQGHLNRARYYKAEKKDALMPEDVAFLIRHANDSLPDGARNKVMLMIGAAGLSAEEARFLDVEDASINAFGVDLAIRLKKKRTVSIKGEEFRAALLNWLSLAGIIQGALIREVRLGQRVGNRLSAFGMRRILKKLLPPRVDGKRYSFSSLAHGYITGAFRERSTLEAMANSVGYSHPSTSVNRYRSKDKASRKRTARAA